MKYEIEINEAPDILKKHISNIIGDKYSLFDNKRVYGRLKYNALKLEYNNGGKRFPSGIVFYGEITGRLNRSKISGFLLSLLFH